MHFRAFVLKYMTSIPLRTLVLVFLNYISIATAFGLLYITFCRSSFNIDPAPFDLVYFSFTTMTAMGMGDITRRDTPYSLDFW